MLTTTITPTRTRQHQRKPRAPRLPQDTLECTLGDVCDLSVSGMRIRGPRLKLDDFHKLHLDCPDMGRLHLIVRVVWSRRVSWFNWESGLEFVDTDERTQAVLKELALVNRKRREM